MTVDQDTMGNPDMAAGQDLTRDHDSHRTSSRARYAALGRWILALGLPLGISLASTAAVHAQAGELDSGFGSLGRGTAYFGGPVGRDEGYGVALLPDGRALIAGNTYFTPGDSDIGFLRLTLDGQLDSTFGVNGVASLAFDLGGTNADYLQDVKIDSAGRIVALGYSATDGDTDVTVARLLADGTIDSTFGTNGYVVLTSALVGDFNLPSALAIQPDNKIVLVGTVDTGVAALAYDAVVVRLTASGALDTSLASTGMVVLDFGEPGFPSDDGCRDVQILDDGKIALLLSVGAEEAVARLTSTGALDPSFNGVGYSEFVLGLDPSVPLAFDVDDSGGFAVAGLVSHSGSSDWDIGVARLDASGALDPSFGAGTGVWAFGIDLGGGHNERVRFVKVRPNGRILLGGSVDTGVGDSDFFAIRLRPDGTLDPHYGYGVGLTTVVFDLGPEMGDRAEAAAVYPNGDMLLVGTADHIWLTASEVAFTRLLGDEPFFEDGFESGSTAGWSWVSP